MASLDSKSPDLDVSSFTSALTGATTLSVELDGEDGSLFSWSLEITVQHDGKWVLWLGKHRVSGYIDMDDDTEVYIPSHVAHAIASLVAMGEQHERRSDPII